MKISEAAGRTLAVPIVRPDGRKVLSRGRRLDQEALRVLAGNGLHEAWVVLLDDDEVGEDEALAQLAPLVAGGDCTLRPGQGHTDFLSTRAGVMIADPDMLHRFNSSGVGVVITVRHFTHGGPATHFARLRLRPFGLPRRNLDTLENYLSLAKGPCVRWLAIHQPRAVVLYTDVARPARAKEQFGKVVAHRGERYGVTFQAVECREDENCIAGALRGILQGPPDLVLIASTTCPAGLDDAVGRALRGVGAVVESFLAPVEPGSLTMLAYHGNTAIVSAPGCLRSAQPNVLDVMLPPLLARHRLDARTMADFSGLGLFQAS